MVKTTGTGNQRNVESRWRTRILPAIGRKRITSLTEQDLQDVVNDAYSDGLAKKSLQSLCADMRAFCKWCRAKKLTTFHPEGLHVPAGAPSKGQEGVAAGCPDNAVPRGHDPVQGQAGA